MSLKKSFLKNLLTVSFFAYIAQAFNYVASIFIFRIITPEEYGVVSMIVVFSGFIAIFSDAGFSFAVIRSDYSISFLKKLSGATVIFGFLLSLLLAFIAKPISWFYNSPELVLPTLCLASTFFLQSFSIIPKAKLQKEEKFKQIGIATLGMQFSNSLTQLILALSGFSFWAFIWGPVLGYTIQAVIYFYKTKLGIDVRSFSGLIQTFKEVKSLVGNVSGFNMINYWARNSDYMMIGKLYDKGILGIYRNAYFLFSLPLNFVGMVVNQVLLPTLQKVVAQGFPIEKKYKYLEGAITILVLPLSILFIIYPKPLILIIWGEKWVQVANYLPYFGIIAYCHAALLPVGTAFILLKKEKMMLKVGSFNAAILIIATIAGAYISVKSLLLFYSAAFFIITCPAVVYFGLIKSFGFNKKETLRYWLIRLILCFIITLGLYYETKLIYCLALMVLSILTITKEKEKLTWLASHFIKKKWNIN